MHLSKTLLVINILLIASSTNFVHASDGKPNFYLGEYVVTATRHNISLKDAPQSIEVIDKNTINKIGATTVRDALKYASNIYIADGNGAHGDKITMRGSNVNDILILHNGKRLPGENFFAANNDSANARALERFNLSNVERIEIVRGQAGALYGSDAQAGVINIITKKSEQSHFTSGFNSGTRTMNNYYHWDSGQQNKISATLDVNLNKLRKFDSKAEGFAYGNGQSYNLDIDYRIDENNNLNLYLDYFKQDYDFDAIYNFRGNAITWNNKRDYERKFACITYDGTGDNNTYTVSTSYGELKSKHNEKELYLMHGKLSAIPKSFERKHKVWNIEARNTFELSENNKFTFGSEMRTVTGNAFVQNASDETKQYAFYLQDEVYIGNKLLLIPSARYDHHDTFGGQASPNVGATYFLSDNSRIKANYGQSYRAPSIDELYGAYDHMGMFTFYGNPNLEPEETTGWEISYEREFNDATKAKLTYFRHKKDNAISYRKISGNGSMDKPDYQFINIGETSTQGVELSYEQELGNGFTLFADYAYLDSQNKSTSERLDYYARNTYTAKLLWSDQTESPWSVALFNRWYSDYRNEGKDYSINTFNISIHKKWADKYRAFIAIDNLFNKHNTNIDAYGRLWRAGIEFTY